ncbi:MAG: hypothetical protein LBP93_02875 [Treponema sp.]|jgi:hypothetical protein|nr:hypothetical protein [Treponema sp.]
MALVSLPGQEGTASPAGTEAAAGDGEAPDAQAEDGDPFPISPLLETAASGRVPWRPDWPPAIPPDAFRLSAGEAGGGGFSAISLGPDPGEYRLRRGENGGWAEFPVFLQGNFYQARTLSGGPEAPAGIIILTEEPWELHILAREGGRPSLLRVTHGGRFYFTVLQYRDRRVSETWYDQEGNAAAVFFPEYPAPGGGEGPRRIRALKDGGEETETYDYDSGGNISALNSPLGEFSALYTADNRPRYWERRTLAPREEEAAGDSPAPEPAEALETRETYTLQWDNRGLLVRVTGTAGTEPVDLRYEYSLDERGNWIGRREIRMLHRFGVLVPVPGTELKRTIEYGD